jgi:hypothetical protein
MTRLLHMDAAQAAALVSVYTIPSSFTSHRHLSSHGYCDVVRLRSYARSRKGCWGAGDKGTEWGQRKRWRSGESEGSRWRIVSTARAGRDRADVFQGRGSTPCCWRARTSSLCDPRCMTASLSTDRGTTHASQCTACPRHTRMRYHSHLVRRLRSYAAARTGLA